MTKELDDILFEELMHENRLEELDDELMINQPVLDYLLYINEDNTLDRDHNLFPSEIEPTKLF